MTTREQTEDVSFFYLCLVWGKWSKQYDIFLQFICIFFHCNVWDSHVMLAFYILDK